MIIAAIDPGVVTLGFAVFDSDTNILRNAGSVIVPAGVRKSLEVVGCVDYLVDEVRRYVRYVQELVFEFPNIRYGSALGAAAAADVLNIAYMIGVLRGTLNNVSYVSLVRVDEWKGSMPKRVCHARVKKLIPNISYHKYDEHALDAIGLGLFALGVFR